MFKYIAEILSQFTKAQKIIALSILLLSIIIISLAPSFISAITTDRKDLEEKILNQESKIKNLEKDINTQEITIRKNQISCTNEIIKRETEFISMMEELKKDIKRENDTRKVEILVQRNVIKNYDMDIEKDSIYEKNTTLDSDFPTVIIKDNQNLKTIISKIETMQKNIRKN